MLDYSLFMGIQEYYPNYSNESSEKADVTKQGQMIKGYGASQNINVR